jgi:hypothetical protein
MEKQMEEIPDEKVILVLLEIQGILEVIDKILK